MNPFDLPGPQFLALYLTLIVPVLLAAWYLRDYLRRPDDLSSDMPCLSAYEVAYLAGGADRAFRTALVSFVQRGVLEIREADRAVVSLSPHFQSDHPLEQALHDAVTLQAPAEGRPIWEVRLAAVPVAREIGGRLRELGLVLPAGQTALVSILPTSLVLGAAVFAGIKIGIGTSQHRPVGWLILACLATVLIAVFGFWQHCHRSERGDRLLQRMCDDNAALESTTRSNVGDLAVEDVALAVGLFDVGILAGGPLASVPAALRVPAGVNGVNVSCATSCGGASCGGDGCGGGCGGCGGCGG